MSNPELPPSQLPTVKSAAQVPISGVVGALARKQRRSVSEDAPASPAPMRALPDMDGDDGGGIDLAAIARARPRQVEESDRPKTFGDLLNTPRSRSPVVESADDDDDDVSPIFDAAPARKPMSSVSLAAFALTRMTKR